ncbi:hypothetical protein QP958_10965 [Corynebacterium marquesiae]|uniref:hypothetical protein n=1 Tax=Corynebacterium marquesiae TaxID=2913503 RepID=UPI00254C5BF0|nr:hypothetical protein [Corynebacterium marquesiae]MDK8455909.1 hypothetical protein [Corynebacterium marquesiae]MDK8726029.1 hypothetical protein [Corynebacterium marquesiae]MDK8771353.1 hypothetical protein [Corynebacterium marquesiae]
MVSVTQMTQMAEAAAKGKIESALKILSPRLDKAEKSINNLQEDLKSLPENAGDILRGLPDDFSTRLTQAETELRNVKSNLAKNENYVSSSQFQETMVDVDLLIVGLIKNIESLPNGLEGANGYLIEISQQMSQLAETQRLVLEAAESPIHLDKASSQAVAQSLNAQMTSSLTSSLEPLVETAVSGAMSKESESLHKAAQESEKARSALLQEKKANEKLLEEIREERKQYNDDMEKSNTRFIKTCMSVSWIAASALVAAIALFAVGALGEGLLTMLGIPDGVSALWGHVQEADGTAPTLGWLALTLTVIAVLIALMTWMLSQAVPGISHLVEEYRLKHPRKGTSH